MTPLKIVAVKPQSCNGRSLTDKMAKPMVTETYTAAIEMANRLSFQDSLSRCVQNMQATVKAALTESVNPR